MANISSVKLPDNSEYNFEDVVTGRGSNDNLLINPWFTVNQRGQSTYSASAGVNYTVDRWKFDFDVTSSTLQVSSSGVTLNNPGAYVVLRQKFEDVSALVNRTITASIKLSDGTIYSGSGVYDGTSDLKLYFDSNSISLQINHANGEFRVVSLKNTLNVRAVKLEIGSTSTLHLDTAPDYSTELLKCQRYFIRYGSAELYRTLGVGTCVNTTACSVAFYTPVQLRTYPTLTYSGLFIVTDAGTQCAVTNIATGNAQASGVVGVTFSVASGLTAGHSALVITNSAGAYIDLSAEL